MREFCEISSISDSIEKLTSQSAVEDYISKNCQRENEFYFYQYLAEKLSCNNIPLSTVINRSRISKNYVYNIVNGTKLNPSRDKVLALCIGCEMTINEMCFALELAGFSRLRGIDERDVRIAIAVNSGVTDVLDINNMLSQYGITLLDV